MKLVIAYGRLTKYKSCSPIPDNAFIDNIVIVVVVVLVVVVAAVVIRMCNTSQKYTKRNHSSQVQSSAEQP